MTLHVWKEMNISIHNYWELGFITSASDLSIRRTCSILAELILRNNFNGRNRLMSHDIPSGIVVYSKVSM